LNKKQGNIGVNLSLGKLVQLVISLCYPQVNTMILVKNIKIWPSKNASKAVSLRYMMFSAQN